jgi:NAD(P)-dependent dehydrogenase (short-subunit alcohol dehydrogenase family)
MPTVLVTGASRGIGREFARQYAAASWRVHATMRTPTQPSHDAVVHALDVTDAKAVAALARAIDEPLDLVINNAGISGPRDDGPGNFPAERWLDTMRTNVVAPALVADAFTPHLARGEKRVIATISSRMGSIGALDTGGRYAYRSSKAAANMVTKLLAFDLKPQRITCVVFHPGWVRTDMGGAGAPVSPEASVAGMRKVIDRIRPADSGKFFNYDGEPLPW